MRQCIQLRINEDHAGEIFPSTEGRSLGSVRVVEIDSQDARLARIRELQNYWHERDEFFFAGWNIRHQYDRNELERAELFHLLATAIFEPSGEECGTQYDESTTCSLCKAGRTLRSDLILDLRKAPKSKHIARTIADEWIISQKLAEQIIDAKLTGLALRRVRHKSRYRDDAVDLNVVPSGRKLLEMADEQGVLSDDSSDSSNWAFHVWLNRSEQKTSLSKAEREHAELRRQRDRLREYVPPVWYQLIITSRPVLMVAPTKCGVNPIDEDIERQYVCPRGHVAGLNLLSEVSVRRGDYDGADIACTQNMVGMREGVLVPAPALLISPRFNKLLSDHNIKGYRTEVAYLV